MAHITADRVKETSTTTGTGAFTLAGAATGYRAFSAVCSVSDTVFYCIALQSGSEWEVGLGTYTSTNVLTRTTVLASSNAGSAVTFSAGTKDVFISAVAAQTSRPVNRQNFDASGTWTKPAGYGPNAIAYIQAWGGGGSGAKHASGGGGGGGGYNERWALLSSLGSTETVTIGSGGAQVTTASTAGNNGGNTTFGSWLTAYGGAGGSTANNGGGGGGQLSAGTNTVLAAGPFAVVYHNTTPGRPLVLIQSQGDMNTFQGGGGTSATATTGQAADAYMHGGGGGASSVNPNAGNSVYGGAGGGGLGGTGGTSSFGGNGGAGSSASAGTAGTQPGGAGGATNTGGNSGAGAAGRITVYVFDGY